MTTKKAIAKLKKSVAAHNRRVNRDNKSFEKMNPSQKRVQIARDVLAQLDSKKLIARNMAWLTTNKDEEGDKYLVAREPTKKELDTEVRDILAKKKTCYGCALGGMFACAVDRANKLKLNDLSFAKNDLSDTVVLYDKDVFGYLGKFFSEDQLNLIEYTFEGGDGQVRTYEIPDSERRDADIFFDLCDDAGELMRMIMQNIVVNKGTFKPEKAPVAVMTMPGFGG